ncbi:MAG: hypothetical protein R2776_03100 [Flavobacteriaceae bacterium]|nr:hypothetical protein [Flavobacteriaceae bacterium]
MSEWFSVLSSFEKIYWIISGVSTFVFLIVLALAFMGSETSDIGGADTEIDSDTGAGFQFFTFKNMVAFFTIFGWSGIACIDAEYSNIITILVSIFCGLVMMFIMALLFKFISKLADSGTLKIENALNSIGEVYLTIGASRSRMGKVHIRVQNSLRELEALTDYKNDLPQGTIIKVIEVTSNGLLIVEPQNK